MEYNLFPAPCGAFVGDVMPMVDNGTLELFYLYDTDHNGQAYHPIHKFTTKNLFEYEDHGLMIGCGKPEEPDLALGTGSVLKGQDGRYHCFYTGHNDVMSQKGFGKECIMHAVSPDKEHWEKIPADTFFPEKNFAVDDFRDPFVFWNEEAKCYWMLVATRETSLGGIIARYTSEDLHKWRLCEPLYAPKSHHMLECPDLFQLGNYYYLFYSWNCFADRGPSVKWILCHDSPAAQNGIIGGRKISIFIIFFWLPFVFQSGTDVSVPNLFIG